MGVIHEETANRGPVSGSNYGFGGWRKNLKDSARCAHRRQAANQLCRDIRPFKGSGITSRESHMDGLHCEKYTGGLRAGLGRPAGTPSLHREEMGNGSDKKTGRKIMKTLVIANQKGGVGKTSTLVHLVFDFLERGLKVCVIDLCPQANASFTLREFDSGYIASDLLTKRSEDLKTLFSISPDKPIVSLIASDDVLADMEKRAMSDVAACFKSNIKALDECGFDVCLIDTAPSLSISMAAALFSADYVLSPVVLEAYSIQGMKKMVMTIANVRKENTKLQFLGMVPSMVDMRNPRHGRHLNELMNAYPTLMIPTRIGLRSGIADALASCKPVWKIKKTAARKAAREIRALANYVYEKMEIK